VGVDTVGEFHRNFKFAFDTTSKKDPKEVSRRMFAARELSKKGLLTAGKDISNPGTLGTLGMLLETSGKGAIIDPSTVPTPEGVDLTHWLLSYQGCGFVLTCSRDDEESVLAGLRSTGLTATVIGNVEDGSRLEMHDPQTGNTTTLFDFDVKPLTGCGPPGV
jgi:selenophosphate synthetase-related protein